MIPLPRHVNRPFQPTSEHGQQGIALLLTLVLLAVAGAAGLIAMARDGNDRIEQDRRTSQALAQAKAALIGYAVGKVLSAGNRFGDLPCPDTDNDGTSTRISTGVPENCAAQSARLGRLPWKTLGIPDLRDGTGERLWYAVSNGFKNNPRTSCVSPTDAGCLNSDSRGTITVRSATGAIVHDASNPDPHLPSGVIAVVIAPGAPIPRPGSGVVQDRGAAGINDPRNYLDTALGEDNADFADGASNNGFIAGPVTDATGTELVNDRIAVVTYEDLLPALERRVARELARCLDQYAAGNGGRYPYAVDIVSSAMPAAGSFTDSRARRFGRLPDAPFTRTSGDSGGSMALSWPGAPCALGGAPAWWTNWKLHAFYAVAEAYSPSGPPAAADCGPNACLSIIASNPVVPPIPARYAILVAGRQLASPSLAQIRHTTASRANVANYLEGRNAMLLHGIVETTGADAAFNDTVVYR